MSETEDPSPAVVLVRPREEGNVGSAARAMANMGLSRLVLVEPAAEIGKTARMFAVGAGFILDGARRAPDLASALAPFARVVATTSTRDRVFDRLPTPPRELPERLADTPPGTETALVFGPEVGGLTNEELALAHHLVTIPCSPVQPTLNLSQAVLLVAYELFLARGSEAAAPVALDGEPPATAGELEGLFGHVGELLGGIGFARDDSYDGVLRDLRKMAGRAVLDRREVRILRGICRRAGHALEGKGRSWREVGR